MRSKAIKDIRSQRGDSIIEVLISVAIVSLVLVSAYAITSQNTKAQQDNQERVQAQHLVESQIEALRVNNGINTSGDCFKGTNETAAISCKTLTASGSGASYTVTVTTATPGVTTPSTGHRKYLVTAKWTSLNGIKNNDSNVTMAYVLD